jgi:hypothetical protein
MRQLLLFLVLFFVGFSFSQTLSSDREKFVKEFDKLMRESTSNDLKSFTQGQLGFLLLETSDFPEDYFSKMVLTANKMIEKRMKPYPDVYSYVFSVYTLAKQKQPKKSYTAWHAALDKMLDGRNVNRFKDFVEISGAFFERNVIALNPNYEWFYVGGEYSFEYEKDPFIKLSNGKLVCKTINRGKNSKEEPYTDSIVILNTSGVYELLRERWIGEGGRLTWEKVGLNPSETYANLKQYQLSMKGSALTCDTVTLHTPFINKPVIGKLTDRAQRGSINENIELPFPHFVSFQRKFEIKNIIQDVDYVGGFSLAGADFVGVGTIEEPASLIFKRNGKSFIKTSSSLVNVSETKLEARNAKIVLYIASQDSIIHPGLNVSYIRKDDEVQLNRGLTGISIAPFINSYHKLDMYVEQIVWKRSGSELDLKYNFATSQQQRKAMFESFDFYDAQLYEKQQAMESVNPLTALYKHAYKYDEFAMTEGKAASALGRTIEQAKSKLLELSALGFIAYDTEKGTISINDKLERFVQAREGKKDFDYIAFSSDLTPFRMDAISPEELAANKDLREYQERMEKRNKERERITSFGSLNLGTLDLKIKAVDNVPISFSKNTLIFPEHSEVVIQKNRQIKFTGWVNAGKWEVHVMNGDYSYESNKFNIRESDKAYFRSNPLKKEHGQKPIVLNSSITGIKGELIVDHEKNRSGNRPGKVFDKYPVLVSKEKTRVYYNYKTIHIGAYDSARFYFELEPFEIDSLATFNEKSLLLAGELTSAGIFPKIKDSLRLMGDYSLGFTKKIPKGGYDFYGTGGKYDNQIILSNNGLQGAGVIEFVNSTSTSKNLFTFLPDSTIGVAKFINRPQEAGAGTAFPDINGEDAFITFLPRKKVLKVRSNKESLDFFNGEAKLMGSTTVRDNGITGSGHMSFKDAQLSAKHFRYNRWEIDSDTATFNLTNTYREPGDLSEDEMAFKTENVTANVNFETRVGDFKSNAGESMVNFPVNKYVCKVDMFKWHMDNDEIELEKTDKDLAIDSDMDLVGPNFFSTHPKQDSLSFRSPTARFSLKEKTIYCSKTVFVEVADARIYPDSMKVTIRKNAKMDKLENSEIVATFITKYHKIVNASTEITAKRAYKASGQYPYYDIDSNKYMIYFPKIGLDSSYQTVASGKIDASEEFKLGPQFDFYGDVSLKAAAPNLFFTGATRITHNCEKFDKNWMSFKANIDPTNIQIPVAEKMKDLNGNSISAGILWRHSQDLEEVVLYPTFLSQVQDAEDPIVITSSGWLQYSEAEKEFQIGSREKLINRGAKGNYIALHTESCSMNGDGIINLGMDYGNLEADAVGVVNYNQATGETSMNITLKLTSAMDAKLFEGVAKRINRIEELKDADFNSTTLEQALLEWDSREVADKIKSDFTLRKEMKKVPKSMESSIVITGLRLSSYTNDEEVKGIRTSTSNAAIVNLYGESVMKYVPMKAFFEQRTIMADRFGLLIEVPGSSVYFFDYDNRKTGTMNILTSDSDLNDGINAIKPDKRKDRKFMYQTTQNSAYKSQFMRVFQ